MRTGEGPVVASIAVGGQPSTLWLMGYTDEPFQTAAHHLLINAPAIAARARALGWVSPTGDVDWGRLGREHAAVTDVWSGAERRLIETVAQLSGVSVWGLDVPNTRVLVEALRAACRVAEASLTSAERSDSLIRRALGREMPSVEA
jgi:hypothetical protein